MAEAKMIKAKLDHKGRFGVIVKDEEYDEALPHIRRALEECPQIFGRKTAATPTAKAETTTKSTRGVVETR